MREKEYYQAKERVRLQWLPRMPEALGAGPRTTKTGPQQCRYLELLGVFWHIQKKLRNNDCSYRIGTGLLERHKQSMLITGRSQIYLMTPHNESLIKVLYSRRLLKGHTERPGRRGEEETQRSFLSHLFFTQNILGKHSALTEIQGKLC